VSRRLRPCVRSRERIGSASGASESGTRERSSCAL
jgi:hypothetical protein